MEVEFKVNSQNQEEPSESSGNLFLKMFEFAEKEDVVLMIIGGAFSAALGATFPILSTFLGDSIDSFSLPQQRLQEASKNLFYQVYLGVGALVAGFVMSSFWNIAGERLSIRCRKEFFKSLIRQEMGWFDTISTTEIVTNFNLDALTLQQAVGEKISTMIMITSMLLTGVGLSFYSGWILSLVLLPAVLLLLLSFAKNMEIIHQQFKQQDDIFSQSDCKGQQSLGAIKIVKAFNGQDFEASIQDALLQKVEASIKQSSRISACSTTAAMLTMYLMFTFTAYYGSECVFDTSKCPSSISRAPYTTGTVFRIFYCLLFPAISLNQLAPSFRKIVDGMAASSRMSAIIHRVPTIRSPENAVKPDFFQGVFVFKNVDFAYPNRKQKRILKNIDLTIDNKHSGFIGKSGSGKSTILQLIMRFYDPDAGVIYLDGIDLRALDLDWLRSQIGYVRQQPVLFATSIRQNLLLANPQASDEDLTEALQKAEALDFIKSLPENLDTYVGSGGSQISGGQKQRIAIARALLKNPKVLMMDEATSALDRINEAQILKTLGNMSNNYMTMSVTHRLRVLSDCDKVYSISKQGKIKILDKLTSRQNIKIKQSHLKEHLQVFNPSNVYRSETSAIKEEEANPSQTLLMAAELKEEAWSPQQSTNYWEAVPHLFKHRCALVFCCCLAFLEGFTFPATGLLFGKVLVNVIQYALNQDYYSSQTYKYCYFMLGVSILGALIEGLSSLSFSYLGAITIKELRSKIQNRLLRVPVSYFEKKENSYQIVVARITTHCKTLNSLIAGQIPIMIQIAVNLAFSLIGGIVLDWRTGLTSIGLLPLLLLAQMIQFSYIEGFASQKQSIYSSSSQIISESISNMRTILSVGPIESVISRYQQNLNGIYEKIHDKSIFSGFMYGLSNLIQFSTFGLIIFFSLYVNQFNVDIQNSLCSVSLILFGCVSVGGKSVFIQDLDNIKIAASWLAQVLNLEEEEQMLIKNGSKMLKTPIRGNITFEGIFFSYESREGQILRDFNLKIAQGEEIIIVGPSGCGKSTIIDMLLGFYTPSEGRILLEGIDIQDYDIHHLRNSFGLVSQEPQLFNESIGWNIKYNLENISQQQIRLAASKANFNPIEELRGSKEILSENIGFRASDMKQQFEDLNFLNYFGFDKNVGPKGSYVSGGQKQRIAIARTLLRKPPIFLLDEATSALDTENSVLVTESLEEAIGGKTSIVITHRLDCLKPQQRICLIDHGKVQEMGSYHQLVEARGLFYDLLQGIKNV